MLHIPIHYYYPRFVIFFLHKHFSMGFSGDSVVKNLPANAGDLDLIPGLGRSPGEGNGNPLHSLCLGNPMDSEA